MRKPEADSFAALTAHVQSIVEGDTARYIGRLAAMALREEVFTTPKPGLVDMLSNGAHTDMDLTTFCSSAEALEPYFAEFAAAGLTQSGDPEGCFTTIRGIGVRAEQAMYAATGGVNTHKGLIFSLGIFCAAAGICAAEGGLPNMTEERLFATEQKMVRRILTEELKTLRAKTKTPAAESHGEHLYKQLGVTGVRGEAIDGFTTVRETGLPVMRAGLREQRDFNLVKVQTLMTYMSRTEDTNVLSRTNVAVLADTQRIAAAFLAEGGAYAAGAQERLVALDGDFIEKNISHGGCADLLALTIFLAAITNHS